MAQNPTDIIRKLLALAQSDNEHEASIAAERASALSIKYGIDLSALNKENAPDIDGTLLTDIRCEQWISNIIAGVCLVNGTKRYRHELQSGEWRYRIVGATHAVKISVMIIEYLLQTVKRLNRNAIQNYDYDQRTRADYRKAFRLAASQRLYQRFVTQYADMTKTDDAVSTGSTAVVVANYFQQQLAIIDKYLENENVTLTQSKTTKITLRSHAGIVDGVKAGQSISLNQQTGTDHGLHGARLSRA